MLTPPKVSHKNSKKKEIFIFRDFYFYFMEHKGVVPTVVDKVFVTTRPET